MLRMFSIRRAAIVLGLLPMGCGDALPSEGVTSEVSSALMAVDPPISDEIEIDAPKQAPGPGSYAKVAYGDGIYLVVWSQSISSSAHLYGTRIAANGEVLDPTGFYIGRGFPNDVIFGGGQFLVATTPLINSPSGDVRVLRISLSGQVLDPGGIVVHQHTGESLTFVYPSLATDGTDFLVAYSTATSDPANHRDLRIARVKADGTLLDPGGRQVAEFIPWAEYPGVAFDGNQYLLVWNLPIGPLVGMRVSKSGNVIDSSPFVIDDQPLSYANIRVIFDGKDFFVGADIRDNGVPIVRIRRVSPNATVDPAPLEVIPSLGDAAFNDMVFDGQNLFVALSDGFDSKSYVFHLTREGAMIEPSPVLIAPINAFAQVAAGSEGSFVVWNEPVEQFTGVGLLMGSRWSATGQAIDNPPLHMSIRATPENAPRVAFDGNNFVIARHDPDGFVNSRISPAGAIMGAPALPITDDSPGVDITQVFSSADPKAPTWIASTGPGNMVFRTSVVRMSSNGELIDTAPIPLPDSNLGPLVSNQYVAGADPQGALFIGQEYPFAQPTPGGTARPFAVRVTNDGALSVSAFLREDPCFPHSATFDGTNYLVTCSNPAGDYPGGDATVTLFAARISPQGEVLEPGWSPITTAPETMYEFFSASFDGKNHLLVWRTEERQKDYFFPDVPTNVKLHGIRVSPEGKPLTEQPFVLAEVQSCGPAAGRALFPAAASMAGTTIVVWSEPSEPASCDPIHLDLVGVEINQDGQVSDPFVVSDEFGTEDSPFIAAQPDGQMLVTYSRFVPDAPYATTRARARFIRTCTCPDGSSCTAGQCDSTSSGAGGSSNPDGPIRFGGCGCRVTETTSAADFGALAALAGLMAARRRRSARKTSSLDVPCGFTKAH